MEDTKMAWKFKTVKSAKIGGWRFELVIDEGEYQIIEYDLDGYFDDYHGGWDSVPVTDDNLNDVLEAWDAWIAKVAGQLEPDGPQPDWEAQARYDEQHGTINGQHAGIVAYEEAFSYGG